MTSPEPGTEQVPLEEKEKVVKAHLRFAAEVVFVIVCVVVIASLGVEILRLLAEGPA